MGKVLRERWGQREGESVSGNQIFYVVFPKTDLLPLYRSVPLADLIIRR